MTRMVISKSGVARQKALSIGILLMTLMACGAIAAQWDERNAQAAPTAATRTVTLITGDRVVISGGDGKSVTVQPRKGRERVVFSTTYQRMKKGGEKGVSEHLFVIPADAQALIGAGRLDPQLFDVTTLLESNYDDSRSGNLPVVVTYESQQNAVSVASSSLAGAAITSRFESVNGLAATVAKQQLGQFWDTLTGRASTAAGVAALSAQNGPIRKIWLDRIYEVLLDQSVPQIGAPLAWQSGYDGTGVRVGVIDTGYDETHPDLVGKVVAYKETTIPYEPDWGFSPLAGDQSGHGTHVASTIAGTGAASNGQYRGVAPGADLVIFRACVRSPDFPAELGCSLGRILEGMHWTVGEGGARIVSMSLGYYNFPDEVDPLEEAVEQLTAQYGVLFVIAAGNATLPESIKSPGSSPSALTVGAVDKTDQIARFSSRGPIPSTYAIKPDITAPGVDIVAALAQGIPADPDANVGQWYTRLSGTSMATPLVAGAAAILLQRHPDWSPAQLKSALMSSAKFNPALTIFDQGAGRVDVPAALATSIASDTPSLSLGLAEFPHEDNPIITRTITYRNVGDVSTSLALSLDVRGPNGTAVPAGMFSIDRTTLTVPVDGIAAVTLTANTRVPAAFGMFAGRLLATGGGKTVAIPFAVFRERPTHEVVLKHLDRNGAPTPNYVTTFVPLDHEMKEYPSVNGADYGAGDIALQIPDGRYEVLAQFYNEPVTLLLYPEFRVGAPATLTLDAREATPLAIAPPTSTARSLFLRTEIQASAIWGDYAFGIQRFYDAESDPSNCCPPIYTGVLGDPAAPIRSFVNKYWQDPAQANSMDGPAVYAAVFTEQGTLVTGTKTIPAAEMSVVRARYSSLSPINGLLGLGLDVSGSLFIPVVQTANVPLPHQRSEYYYSNDENARWQTWMWSGSQSIYEPSIPYKPRQAYITRWNEPPFAPTLPNYNPKVLWSYRTGDTMTVQVPILGDRLGHVISVQLDDNGATGGKLALYRNGERIAQVLDGFSENLQLPAVVVPPEPATYRIEADATPRAVSLSTRVTGVWTFQSEHVASGETTQLPLLTVRFKPSLNERGEAVRDAELRIPVSVYQLDQQNPVQVSDLRIDASFDDGVSWNQVPVTLHTGQWIAVVNHPQQGEYVSLRAKVTGLSANTGEITLIRAYALTDGVLSAR